MIGMTIIMIYIHIILGVSTLRWMGRIPFSFSQIFPFRRCPLLLILTVLWYLVFSKPTLLKYLQVINVQWHNLNKCQICTFVGLWRLRRNDFNDDNKWEQKLIIFEKLVIKIITLIARNYILTVIGETFCNNTYSEIEIVIEVRGK